MTNTFEYTLTEFIENCRAYQIGAPQPGQPLIDEPKDCDHGSHYFANGSEACYCGAVSYDRHTGKVRLNGREQT